MLTLQRLIADLTAFWEGEGCLIEQPYDLPMGAGTMHPATFLKVLGPDPWRCAYVQPSRRPAEGRYGENPFRLGKHLQLQVVMKPSPDDVQEMYLRSLERLGVTLAEHDIRFEEDNWEAPTLGAWGVGWQVLMDGMEITQFTYFQQAGGIDLAPITAEITYGLERIAMFLNKLDSVFDVQWSGDTTYGQVRREDEVELSKYGFEVADAELASLLFDRYEGEASRRARPRAGRSRRRARRRAGRATISCWRFEPRRSRPGRSAPPVSSSSGAPPKLSRKRASRRRRNVPSPPPAV
ncbi:MAG: glycine--tRNA ligase subunit alpha [Acidobacteria bacterium]|nr:glycine--tRNA ligase subunit alpha [Acidobacteriota bacterium]